MWATPREGTIPSSLGIKTGQAIDDVTQTRGAAGMPPRKILKFICSLSTFGAILGPSTL